MNTNQFWQKASDILTIHKTRHNHAILTDEEKRETVTDFLVDMDTLASEWFTYKDREVKDEDRPF